MSKMGNKLLEMEEQSKNELSPADLEDGDKDFMEASLLMDFRHNLVNLFAMGKTAKEIREMTEAVIKELTTDPILENQKNDYRYKYGRKRRNPFA